ASRVATALTVVLSLVATVFMNQISKVWELLLTLGAGTGLVYILRWYWWRVNAWSEVAAMTSALVTSVSLRSLGSHYAAFDPATPRGFAMTLVTTTVVTTAVWLSTTFATRPEPREKLLAFYEKVRPAGPGWKRIAGSEGVAARRGEIPRNLAFWGLGTVFDLASLTKPVATATSVMILVERGSVALADPVVKYLSEFGAGGGDRERVTVGELLTHRAGLAADDPIELYTGTKEEIFSRKYRLPLESPPGARFRYSDAGYEVLGELVGKVAGMPLDEF